MHMPETVFSRVYVVMLRVLLQFKRGNQVYEPPWTVVEVAPGRRREILDVTLTWHQSIEK